MLMRHVDPQQLREYELYQIPMKCV